MAVVTEYRCGQRKVWVSETKNINDLVFVDAAPSLSQNSNLTNT